MFLIPNSDLWASSDLGAPSERFPSQRMGLYRSSRFLTPNSDLLANSDLWALQGCLPTPRLNCRRNLHLGLLVRLLTPSPCQQLLRQFRLTHLTHRRPLQMCRLRLERRRLWGSRQEKMLP